MDTEARDRFNFMRKKFKITAKTLHDVIDRYYDGKFLTSGMEFTDYCEQRSKKMYKDYHLNLPDGEIKRR